jgi:LacI family transcriptional regulator
MRSRVLAAADALGYEPNLLWEGHRLGATRTVGIVVRDISSPHWSDIALGAELLLQEHGYSMLLSNSQADPSSDTRQYRLLDQRRVDGLLISPTDAGDPDTLAFLERLRIPFVAIDRELPARLGGSTVLLDHRRGARALIAHLLALGHRSIAFVSPPRGLRPAEEAIEELEAACREAGTALLVDAGPFSPEHGAAAVERMLAAGAGCTAVVAGSNQIIPGVLQALKAHAVRIPGDVSVASFEDLALLSVLDPAISVVSRKPRLVGSEAARLLLDLLAGRPPESVTVPTAYIARGSCGPAP